jgi:short-subunit dehydrogenase
VYDEIRNKDLAVDILVNNAGQGVYGLFEETGDDKVISGLKNKVSVTMSNMMTDSKAADMMKKQQDPATQNKKK